MNLLGYIAGKKYYFFAHLIKKSQANTDKKQPRPWLLSQLFLLKTQASLFVPTKPTTLTVSLPRSPSVLGDRTRDDLIDSIVHTRTREHRAMPGFRDASSWEERRDLNIDCDKVYPGIFLANGDTIK